MIDFIGAACVTRTRDPIITNNGALCEIRELAASNPTKSTHKELDAACFRFDETWSTKAEERITMARVGRDTTGDVCVYFVYGDGLIKIGITSDLDKRFKCLAASSPVKLRLIGFIERGSRDLERKLHLKFRNARRHGEWFSFSQGIFTYISMNGEFAIDPGEIAFTGRRSMGLRP